MKYKTYPPGKKLTFALQRKGVEAVACQGAEVAGNYSKGGHEATTHFMKSANVVVTLEPAVHLDGPVFVFLVRAWTEKVSSKRKGDKNEETVVNLPA